MVEAIFPPSSNWFLGKIISTREDGSVAYGSQNHIFVLEIERNGHISPCIIDAHKEKVKSVAFCPAEKNYEYMNLILSSSDDGFVKVWNIHSQDSVIGHNSHSATKDLAKVVCASWSPYNPKYAVSVAENDTVVLWNTGSNTTTRFYFAKLKPSVVECSYHNEKIVGVGSKSGMIFIIQLVGKGETLHRLRGHDKEIQGLSWCPIFDFQGTENISQQCFLASSCQEKEIFIWRAGDGSCLTKLPLPKSSLLGTGEQVKWDPANTFIPLLWTSPNHLYTSSKWGELVCCNPERIMQSEETKNAAQNKQTGPSNYWKLVHKVHANVILAIAGMPIKYKKDGSKMLDDWLTKDENKGLECIVKGLGTAAVGLYEPTTLPKRGLIWTIGKDQKLVAIGKDPRQNPRYYFHTINGSAFVSEVLPIDPHVLAIGAGDGKIRKWNVTEMSGEAHVYGQKINDRVYSLAWHPCRETVLGFGTSEGRVGIIDVFSSKPPAHFMTAHSGKVYRMSWGPAPTEKEKTSIDKKDLILYSVGGHKILFHMMNLKSEHFNIPSDVPCKKYVDLAWRSDFKLLAVGSKRGYIYILKYPKLEVINSVFATSKCVMSLTWHPSLTTLGQDCALFRGYVTFASIDNENVIKVYNCTEVNDTPKMEQVSLLKGHSGYVQFVSWNPHISGRIVSCSADFTVRIWDVTASTQLIVISVSHSILPLFCMWSPIDPDMLITGYTERTVISFRISGLSRMAPVLRVVKLEKGSGIRRSEALNDVEGVPAENNGLEGSSEFNQGDVNALNLARRNEEQRVKKEDRMFKAAWNPEANLFQSCYELLKAEETDTVSEYSFSFLKPPDDFFEHIRVEDEAFKASHNLNFHYQLCVWRGNLNEVIEERMNTGQLDDYLLSLAPFVSNRMWQRACEAYAKVLLEKNQYRKAATYLLAIHKISEAIDMLVNANMFLEAICIARCRIPDQYPLFPSLVKKYADWLAETGNTLRASECYIYLNEFSEAVTVLAKKNQPEHLSLAALAARRANLYDLEGVYAYRALVICLETEKFEMASRICSDHQSVKKLYPLFRTHQVLVKLDTKQIVLEKDLIYYLKCLTKVDRQPDLYATLQYIYDRNMIYTTKRNMFVILAHELILACAAQDKEIFLTHIIKAMNTASKLVRREKTDSPMVYKLITWLCPGGTAKYLSPGSIFGSEDETPSPKIISLRAYLCLGIADYMRYILNQKLNYNDMSLYPAMLDKLINYGLDEYAFAYFRDQVSIKTVEKNINDAYRRKNAHKDNSLDKEAHAKINGMEMSEACWKEDALEPEKDNRVSEDDVISVESEKMAKMKAGMKEFEDLRVSSPNPAVIYCLLREVLEGIKEMERLNIVEKKFKKLQKE